MLTKEETTKLKSMLNMSKAKWLPFAYIQAGEDGNPILVIDKIVRPGSIRELRSKARKKIQIMGEVRHLEGQVWVFKAEDPHKGKFQKNLKMYFGKQLPMLKKAVCMSTEEYEEYTTDSVESTDSGESQDWPLYKRKSSSLQKKVKKLSANPEVDAAKVKWLKRQWRLAKGFAEDSRAPDAFKTAMAILEEAHRKANKLGGRVASGSAVEVDTRELFEDVEEVGGDYSKRFEMLKKKILLLEKDPLVQEQAADEVAELKHRAKSTHTHFKKTRDEAEAIAHVDEMMEASQEIWNDLDHDFSDPVGTVVDEAARDASKSAFIDISKQLSALGGLSLDPLAFGSWEAPAKKAQAALKDWEQKYKGDGKGLPESITLVQEHQIRMEKALKEVGPLNKLGEQLSGHKDGLAVQRAAVEADGGDDAAIQAIISAMSEIGAQADKLEALGIKISDPTTEFPQFQSWIGLVSELSMQAHEISVEAAQLEEHRSKLAAELARQTQEQATLAELATEFQSIRDSQGSLNGLSKGTAWSAGVLPILAAIQKWEQKNSSLSAGDAANSQALAAMASNLRETQGYAQGMEQTSANILTLTGSVNALDATSDASAVDGIQENFAFQSGLLNAMSDHVNASAATLGAPACLDGLKATLQAQLASLPALQAAITAIQAEKALQAEDSQAIMSGVKLFPEAKVKEAQKAWTEAQASAETQLSKLQTTFRGIFPKNAAAIDLATLDGMQLDDSLGPAFAALLAEKHVSKQNDLRKELIKKVAALQTSISSNAKIKAVDDSPLEDMHIADTFSRALGSIQKSLNV